MTKGCKLCEAIVKSQREIAERLELPAEDAFSRDPDICNACLARDFSRRPPPLLELASLMYAAMIAVPLSMILWIARVRSFGWSMLPTVLVYQIVGIVVFGVIIRLVLPAIVLARIGPVHQSPEEKLAEAERFYWLARWAAITGRGRFERRMLRQAREFGFKR